MLNGYLSEKQYTELIELGLDINKIYDDEPRYYIKEVFRIPSKKELQEDCDLDENDVILVDVKLIYTENINRFKETKRVHYYPTISEYQLLNYLNETLEGGYKIDNLFPDDRGIYNNYKNIEYMDGTKHCTFSPKFPCIHLIDILFYFIKYLLINKPNLL